MSKRRSGQWGSSSASSSRSSRRTPLKLARLAGTGQASSGQFFRGSRASRSRRQFPLSISRRTHRLCRRDNSSRGLGCRRSRPIAPHSRLRVSSWRLSASSSMVSNLALPVRWQIWGRRSTVRGSPAHRHCLVLGRHSLVRGYQLHSSRLRSANKGCGLVWTTDRPFRASGSSSSRRASGPRSSRLRSQIKCTVRGSPAHRRRPISARPHLVRGLLPRSSLRGLASNSISKALARGRLSSALEHRRRGLASSRQTFLPASARAHSRQPCRAHRHRWALEPQSSRRSRRACRRSITSSSRNALTRSSCRSSFPTSRWARAHCPDLRQRRRSRRACSPTSA